MLRLIGDPATRYREDPVRMLRAVRFAAKLDFDMDAATEAPIRELAPLLLQIPPARLFDEILKLFLAGHALDTFHALRHHGLFPMLFPEADEALQVLPWAEPLMERALANTDDRIRRDRPVTPAFLIGAILWPAVTLRHQALIDDGMPEVPALHSAAQQVVGRQLVVPRRIEGGHEADQLLDPHPTEHRLVLGQVADTSSHLHLVPLRIEPASGFNSRISMRIAVVLHAPLRPKKANVWPSGTSSDRS